jgi:hypothetical protein
MSKTVSSISDILNALPEVKKAVKVEIAARAAAGEQIASHSENKISFGAYYGRGTVTPKVSKRKLIA